MSIENKETMNPLGYEPIGKLIGKFAIPCVVSMIVNSLYNIVDQIFIGRGVGYLGNGATNIVFPITVITLAIALLIGDGGAAFLSLKLGKGEKEDANHGVGNTITMAIASGVLLLILCGVFFEKLLYLFGCTEILFPYAYEYGRVILIGIPFVVISTALNSVIRADGSPKYAMLSMVIGAVINTVLDPIFIFGLNMGVFGAAIATIAGQIVSCIISLMYLRKFNYVKVKRIHLKPRGKYCASIASLGISSFIIQIAIVIVMAVNNNLLVKYGAQSVYGSEIPLTALGITMKVNQIMISVVVGIAAGAQPIIGYNYGAGKMKRVKSTLKWSITAATCVTAICFIAFQFAPQSIINIFGSEEGLYNEFAVKCFKIFLLACIFNGFQTVVSIFLQAIGKPVQSAILSLVRQIIVLIPGAVIMSGIIGVEGVLWSGPIADTTAFVVGFVLFVKELKKMKKSTETDKEEQEDNLKNYQVKMS